MHPPPSLTQANYSIMIECTPESGRCHSVYTLSAEAYVSVTSFCLDFLILNHREEGMVFYQVFLYSPLQCTATKLKKYLRGCVSQKKQKSKGKAVEMTVNSWISSLERELQGIWAAIVPSRKLKSRYGARNRFHEPSLELSSQATWAGGPVRQPYAYLVPSPHSGTKVTDTEHTGQRLEQ